MNALTLLRVSRPRFWLYLGGTFLLGLAFALPAPAALVQLSVLLVFLCFLLPANLFLYGINDLADGDTDKYNPKKGTKEHLLRGTQVRALTSAVWVSAFIIVAVAAWFALQGLWVASLMTLLFLALGAAYSAKPLRLKAKPVLDSASNVLYVLPGLVGYAFAVNQVPQWEFIAAFVCWTAAMHLFSAIPDIAADKRAKLMTTATVLSDAKIAERFGRLATQWKRQRGPTSSMIDYPNEARIVEVIALGNGRIGLRTTIIEHSDSDMRADDLAVRLAATHRFIAARQIGVTAESEFPIAARKCRGYDIDRNTMLQLPQ